MRMKIDVTLDYALESPGPELLLIEAAGVHGQILNRTNIDLGQPLKLARVPAEEGISEADVADRVDLDPEEQPNRTDPVQGGSPPGMSGSS